MCTPLHNLEHTLYYFSFIFVVAVDDLRLVSNDSWTEDNGTKSVMRFEELTDSYVSCRSSGGNPKPTLHITRAGSDITSELDKVEEQVEPTGNVHYPIQQTH